MEYIKIFNMTRVKTIDNSVETVILYTSISHMYGPRYLLYPHAAKAQASLCICTDLPEPSLLAYTKYG